MIVGVFLPVFEPLALKNIKFAALIYFVELTSQ